MAEGVFLDGFKMESVVMGNIVKQGKRFRRALRDLDALELGMRIHVKGVGWQAATAADVHFYKCWLKSRKGQGEMQEFCPNVKKILERAGRNLPEDFAYPDGRVEFDTMD